MSRAPIADEDAIVSAPILTIDFIDRVAGEQREDQINDLIIYLEQGNLPDDIKKANTIVAERGQMWID